MTLPDCCPCCTRLRRDHPGLVEDLLVFPTFLQSSPQEGRKMRDGKVRVIGCTHVRCVFGPWKCLEDAEYAVKAHFEQLRVQKERNRETLNLTFTPNEPQAPVSRPESTEPQGNATQVPPETPEGPRYLPEELAGDPPGLPGADDAAMAEAPVCEVGGSIWMAHDHNWQTGRCSRCGWTFPRLTGA